MRRNSESNRNFSLSSVWSDGVAGNERTSRSATLPSTPFVPAAAAMEVIARAVCPANASPLRRRGRKATPQAEGKAGTSLSSPPAGVFEQLNMVREIKHALIGNAQAKSAALELGIIGEVFRFLREAEAVSDGAAGYESALLQAMGIVCIITSGSQAALEEQLVPLSLQLLSHILKALRIYHDRLTSITLRAISALQALTCVTRDSFLSEVRSDGDRDKSSVSTMLSEICEHVINEVTEGDKWDSPLRTLGAEALAGLTRDSKLARMMVPIVVSIESGLLRPLMSYGEPRYGIQAPVSPIDPQHARDVTAVLQILLNLSCAEPNLVSTWLTSSGIWGALRGLEVELNNSDDKVRLSAALVLVNCFKGEQNAQESRRSPRINAARITCTRPDTEKQLWTTSQALDAVIAHRVLPLFYRTLRTWASLPAEATCPAEYAAQEALLCHGAAVARALNCVMRLCSWQQQHDAVAYGAVDALAAFLRRYRVFELEPRSEPPAVPDERYAAGMVILAASRAALGALRALCASYEPARERVVAVGFHAAVVEWLSDEMMDLRTGRPTGIPGDDPAVLFADLLDGVKNLGRSSVSCAALVRAKAHEKLIRHVSDEDSTAVGKHDSWAADCLALATEGLANMALQHEVVKEAIASSDCMRRVCRIATDSSAQEHVRTACIALLNSTCFLAPLHVRVEAVYCLGGVEGMLSLVKVPREDPALLPSLRSLRNILHAVPLWALCRVGSITRDNGGDAETTPTAAPEITPGAAVPQAAAGWAEGNRPAGRESGHESADRSVSGTILRASNDRGRRTWRGWRQGHAGTRGAAGSRQLWGELGASASGDTARGPRRTRGRPEPMDVEFQPYTRFSRGTTERDTEPSIVRRGRGKEMEGAWGFSRLVEAILGALEGAPTGDRCDETSCAALRLLHTLSTTDESQRAALRRPRILDAVKAHLVPDEMSRRQTSRYPSSGGSPGVSSRGRRNQDYDVTSRTFLGASPPPWEAADVEARLLLSQLMPEHAGNAMATVFAALSAAGVTSDIRAAMDAELARQRAASGAATTAHPSAGAWCSGLDFDEPGATGRSPDGN